jgi:hypothetical protein
MALLAELRHLRTLGSPEEFFERRKYGYRMLLENLGKNQLIALEETMTADRLYEAS